MLHRLPHFNFLGAGTGLGRSMIHGGLGFLSSRDLFFSFWKYTSLSIHLIDEAILYAKRIKY